MNRRLMLLETARRRTQSVATMTPEQIRAARDPELAVPGVPPGFTRALGRAIFGASRPGVAVDEVVVRGAAGALPARRFRPAPTGRDRPLLVYLHGGGWVLGSRAGNDWLCTALAADADLTVVSVEYRMAPEHPAPAAAEDAVAAVRALAEDPAAVGATGPVGVAGDSAGGNLAALAALALPDALAAQVLIYPATDLTRSFPSHAITDAPLLPREDMDAYLGAYLAGGADPTDAAISPWFAEDLAGLPPALTLTATADPLKDEGRAWAERLEAAGVPSRWTEYADAPHGFLSVPGAVPVATQAVHEIAGFLRRRLHGEVEGPRPRVQTAEERPPQAQAAEERPAASDLT